MTELNHQQRMKAQEQLSTIHVVRGRLDSGAPFFALVQTNALVGEQLRNSDDPKQQAALLRQGTLLTKGLGHEVPKALIQAYQLDKNVALNELFQ